MAKHLKEMLQYLDLSPEYWIDLLDRILNLIYANKFGILPLNFKEKFSGKWEEKYTWNGVLVLPDEYTVCDWMQGRHKDLCINELFTENEIPFEYDVEEERSYLIGRNK